MKSPKNNLTIGKKIIIKKVETFRDLMITTTGVENKQQKILELIDTKDDIFSDSKYGFQISNCLCLTLKHITDSGSKFLMQLA